MLEINFLKLTMQATKKRVEEDGWLGTEEDWLRKQYQINLLL